MPHLPISVGKTDWGMAEDVATVKEMEDEFAAKNS